MRRGHVVVLLALAACAGSRPEGAREPVPGPQATLEPARLEAMRAELIRTSYCGEGVDPERAYVIEGHHTMPDGSHLLMVRCALFAYQASYRFVRMFPNDAIMAVSLALPNDPRLGDLVDREESLAGALLGIPELDPQDGSVEVLCKHRGPGDCGVLARFVFDGSSLTLATARAETCEAAAARDEPLSPPSWPVVYP